MKRFLYIIIRVSLLNFLFLMVFVGYSVIQQNNSAQSNIQQNKTETNEPASQQKQNTLTPGISGTVIPTQKTTNLFDELPNHNSRTDCWISYDGHIYDITLFFGSHPGGDTIILKYCGSDATAAFNSKDMNPQNPHSQNAHAILSQFLLQ